MSYRVFRFLISILDVQYFKTFRLTNPPNDAIIYTRLRRKSIGILSQINLSIIGENMKSINWANVAIMTVVVITVLWAATIVCLLWEIREALDYMALATDAQHQMLDQIWGEMSWLLQDLFIDVPESGI